MSNFWRDLLAVLFPAVVGFALGMVKMFCSCKKLLKVLKRRTGDDDAED